LFHTWNLPAQESIPFGNRHGLGLISGYGFCPGQLGYDAKYEYNAFFIQPQYYYAFLRKRYLNLEILVQPQFNITRFRHVDLIPDETMGFEYGLNAGILVRGKFFRNSSFYTFVSTGPHYVYGTPERQVEKFIFSDNFFVGVNTKIAEKLYLDIRPGYRHMSNLDIKKPNHGIENIIFSGGILLCIK